MRIKTSASLMCANSCHLLEDMRKLEKGGIDWLQFDIMDNHFVPNITLKPVIIKFLRDKTYLPFDAHLQITNFVSFIPPVAKTGYNIIFSTQQIW